jgi:hypothetical protein
MQPTRSAGNLGHPDQLNRPENSMSTDGATYLTYLTYIDILPVERNVPR